VDVGEDFECEVDDEALRFAQFGLVAVGVEEDGLFVRFLQQCHLSFQQIVDPQDYLLHHCQILHFLHLLVKGDELVLDLNVQFPQGSYFLALRHLHTRVPAVHWGGGQYSLFGSHARLHLFLVRLH
jgi:hypothetical protein